MALSKKLRRNRGWIAAAILIAVGGTVFVVQRRSAEETPTVSYTTEAVTPGTISVTVSGTGNVEVGDTTEVWPDSGGSIASIAVEEGSTVTTGTVLFKLDAAAATANTAKAYASYLQAKQGVASAEAQLLRARADLRSVTERSQLATPTATTDDMAAAKANIQAAEAGIASAKAARTSASVANDNALAAEDSLTVISPCSGTVSELNAKVGDTVAAAGGSSAQAASGALAISAGSSSSAPVVISTGEALVVKLSVNEVDVPALAVGQRADIEFDALPKLPATGKVREISNEGLNTQGVVTFDVYITLDVVETALRPSMSAAAIIVTNVATDTLLVPNAAVKSDGGGYYVQMLDSAVAPQKVTVEVGLMNTTQTQILSGISSGDKVVTQTIDNAKQPKAGGFMLPGSGGGPRG